MKPINKRRSTNQFCINATTFEQVARLSEILRDRYAGWKPVAWSQDAEDLENDTIAVRAYKTDVGLVDMTFDFRGRCLEVHWLTYYGTRTDREPLTDAERAWHHQRDVA